MPVNLDPNAANTEINPDNIAVLTLSIISNLIKDRIFINKKANAIIADNEVANARPEIPYSLTKVALRTIFDNKFIVLNSKGVRVSPFA